MKGIAIAKLALPLALCASTAFPCEWEVGYFHKVSALRGKVVGVSRGDPRQKLRWLRQRALVPNVKLTLFEYRLNVKSRAELPEVKSVTTDGQGRFGFGSLKPAQYTVMIASPWNGEEWFDVQVTETPNEREALTIDISPVSPDCKGGHEFVVDEHSSD